MEQQKKIGLILTTAIKISLSLELNVHEMEEIIFIDKVQKGWLFENQAGTGGSELTQRSTAEKFKKRNESRNKPEETY